MTRKRKSTDTISKESYGIVQEYSEYSTVQGVVYILQRHQTVFGKIFWMLVVFLMILLSIYWSAEAYNSWQDSPVITTVQTSAYPLKDLEYPAVTVCGQGSNDDVLASGFFNLFFKYLRQKGVSMAISPLKAATILKKKTLLVCQPLSPCFGLLARPSSCSIVTDRFDPAGWRIQMMARM